MNRERERTVEGFLFFCKCSRMQDAGCRMGEDG